MRLVVGFEFDFFVFLDSRDIKEVFYYGDIKEVFYYGEDVGFGRE